MFINPFEYEMYKYLDVPSRADDAQQQVAANGTWRRWFSRREWQADTKMPVQPFEKS